MNSTYEKEILAKIKYAKSRTIGCIITIFCTIIATVLSFVFGIMYPDVFLAFAVSIGVLCLALFAPVLSEMIALFKQLKKLKKRLNPGMELTDML